MSNASKIKVVIISVFLLVPCYLAAKKAVFIVGVHRSGTSATAGVLRKLGLYLGKDEDLLAASNANEKGFFEHKRLLYLNHNILRDYKNRCNNFDPLKINWQSKTTQELKNKVKKELKNQFGTQELFGFKDPRLCLLLPLYLQASRELGFEPNLIIVRRKKLEIIASLAKRDKIPQAKAVALVNQYLLGISTYTKDCKTKTVHFDRLINNTNKVIFNLKAFLPELKKNNFSYTKEAQNFISKDLKHHNMLTPIRSFKFDH